MEHHFSCPYCGERISMVVDMSVRRQTYIEDCEICCRPIQIRYTVVGSDLAEFTARSMNENS